MMKMYYFGIPLFGALPSRQKSLPGFGEAFSVPKAGLEPARLLKDIGF